MPLNHLASNVTDGNHTCLVSGDVTYIVDRNGNVTPTTRQCTHENCYLYLKDKDLHSPFNGYICARQSGSCICADLVTDLHGSSHLQSKYSPYRISAAANGDYLLVALSTPAASSVIPFATNGDLHVGPNGGLPRGPAAGRSPRPDRSPGDE